MYFIYIMNLFLVTPIHVIAELSSSSPATVLRQAQNTNVC